MVEFKAKADAIIKKRWGIEVEHIFATRKDGQKMTYDWQFRQPCGKSQIAKRTARGETRLNYGFPIRMGAWCNSRLKTPALDKTAKSVKGSVQYIGIAADEPKRLARLDGVTKISPLALIGWAEADCMEWCIKNDLRSPIYDFAKRGGCWFCYNMTLDEMRHLRTEYPNLWEILLRWDDESVTTFHPDGHTVHDYDRRFAWEDDGFKPSGKQFRWSDIDNAQINIDQILGGNE